MARLWFEEDFERTFELEYWKCFCQYSTEFMVADIYIKDLLIFYYFFIF